MLIELIKSAETKKPKFGSPCNNCGWCCMTEVCDVGRKAGAGEMIPCKFLTYENGKKLCGLAKTDADKKIIGIGTGCDAMTQKEIFAMHIG